MLIQIEYQNHLYTAEAQLLKGKLWVHFQGRTWCIENDKKKYGKASQAKASTGDIQSPMPGKVTKILKSVGDTVQAGDAILVMEAMKMEYTLKADIGGKVGAVTCSVGDQVVLGKQLAKIDPVENNENG